MPGLNQRKRKDTKTMTKEERIENKRAELLQIYADLSENELKVAAGLIDQAAFLSVTLEDLAESITKNGTIEEYTNGKNQSGRKISSDAKLYNSLVAKYTAITTKLLQLVPKAKTEKPERKEQEKNAAADLEAEKRRQRERAKTNAFLEAVKNGECDQNDYKEFYAAWEKEHSA